jgi:hypothetical protein
MSMPYNGGNVQEGESLPMFNRLSEKIMDKVAKFTDVCKTLHIVNAPIPENWLLHHDAPAH